MAKSVCFRVHFIGGDYIDVDAPNPNAARDKVREIRKADEGSSGIVSKVKVLKEGRAA